MAAFESKKVAQLADLADYQEGAIVSRTILDKRAGTVTLFAFAEGQGLSEHTAPYDALVYILDGEAEVAISDQGFSVGEGELLIMPANEPHAEGKGALQDAPGDDPGLVC